MTSQHATYNELKKTARQYQIEERRRQVAIMVAQGMSEVDIAAKLGVDNTTISKDVKALNKTCNIIMTMMVETRKDCFKEVLPILFDKLIRNFKSFFDNFAGCLLLAVA